MGNARMADRAPDPALSDDPNYREEKREFPDKTVGYSYVWVGPTADGETVGEKGEKVDGILKAIFHAMDDNGDGELDESEGIAIGQAMGESEEQARKSWKQMCSDMDVDGNTTIDLAEWASFYKKSLKDADLKDVMEMLNQMLATIQQTKGIACGQ